MNFWRLVGPLAKTSLKVAVVVVRVTAGLVWVEHNVIQSYVPNICQ